MGAQWATMPCYPLQAEIANFGLKAIRDKLSTGNVRPKYRHFTIGMEIKFYPILNPSCPGGVGGSDLAIFCRSSFFRYFCFTKTMLRITIFICINLWQHFILVIFHHF